MIYQIFYNKASLETVQNSPDFIKRLGVNDARYLQRVPSYIYDDERSPNLTEHNTLCEWRALYYIWKHYPSSWVGFTSWQHDRKGFTPMLHRLNLQWVKRSLEDKPIAGFVVKPLKPLMVRGIDRHLGVTLKSQFLQWSKLERISKADINDNRAMPMGRFHSESYWDFVIDDYRRLYGVDLEKEIDWSEIGQNEFLHTWCNAFVAKWDYFDAYMRQFSPIVFNLLEYFGSHPLNLELSYICERLIIMFNYIRFTHNNFFPSASGPAKRDQTNNDKLAAHYTAAVADNTNPTSAAYCKGSKLSHASKGISIITCSVEDEKFDGFENNVRSTFGQDIQLIRVADARSLAEGYNRGVQYASGDTLMFCHDDIRFLNSSIPAIVRQDLQCFDIVGVAGTTKLVAGKWYAAGLPFTHGQVIHSSESPSGDCYQLCCYGPDSDIAVVKGIQALDGLFLSVNRSVFDRVQFDSQLFDGFHLYDLDFTYSAYLMGMQIAVDYRIPLLHYSGGSYDHHWKRYEQRFIQKYAGQLADKGPEPNCAIEYYSSKSLEFLTRAMRLKANSCCV